MADSKKNLNMRRSTSGRYMDIVLAKQMSGFHVALGAASKGVERTLTRGSDKKPTVKSKAK